MKIRIFGLEHNLFLLISTFIIFVSLLGLGTWQLNRLKEKNIQIELISKTIESDPVNIGFGLEDLGLYEKVQIDGSFLDKNIYLYGRRSGRAEKDGYYILSPFKQTDSDKVILVSRGWAPQSLKTKIENNEVLLSNSEQVIVGITRPGEKSTFLVPDNDIEKNIWFHIDLDQATKHIGTNIDTYYLMQIDNENLPSGMQKHNPVPLTKIRNDHLEYAITWYTLAGALLIIYLVYCRKGQVKNNKL